MRRAAVRQETRRNTQRVLLELKELQPSVERWANALQELARLARAQPDQLPDAVTEQVHHALLLSQQAVNAAHAICTRR